MARNKYKVWCETDDKWECVYSNAAPTECPTDSEHDITASKTTIVDSGDYSGYAAYFDDATASTPISVTKDTWTTLTNDGVGTHTDEVNMSDLVTMLYDCDNDSFYFNDLPAGSSIECRIALSIDTTVANTHAQLRLKFDTGGFTFHDTKGKLNINQATAVDTQSTSVNFEFYLEDASVRDSTCTIEILTSEDVDVEVSNFYIKVLK